MSKNLLINYQTIFYLFKSICLLLLFSACSCPKTGNNLTESDKLANEIANKLPHHNPDSCLGIIKNAQGITEEHKVSLCMNIIYSAFDGLNSEVYLKHLDNFEAFMGEEKPTLMGTILIHRGLKFKEMGQYDTALSCMKAAKHIFIQENDSSYIAQTLRRMAEVYNAQGHYVAATSHCLEMLSYLGKKKDLEWEYAMTGMVMCYRSQKKYIKAKDLIWETIKVSEMRKDTAFTSYKYLTLSMVYLALKQIDSAVWAVQKSAAMAKSCHYKECNDITLADMGIIWREKGNFEKGLAYSQTAFHAFDSLGNKESKIRTYNDIGHCYAMAKQWDKAEAIYLENLAEIKKINKKEFEITTYDSLVSIGLKREGNYKIWNYLRKSRELRDSLYSVEKDYIMEDLNVQYETAEREKRIKELAMEQKMLRMSIIIVFLLFFIALCAIAWLVYRHKQKRLLLLQENQLLAAKEQLHLQDLATKEKLHAVELASHKQQLENFKQNIFLKNQIICDLENRIQHLLPTSEEISQEYERNKALLSEIRILTEKDWKTYLTYFEKVYEGFMERVIARFPDLTPAELRLFLLLKQEADNKDIANILGISPSSVKKSRQRLRKKLTLLEEEDLDAFVLAF